jgi:hypothetical protein
MSFLPRKRKAHMRVDEEEAGLSQTSNADVSFFASKRDIELNCSKDESKEENTNIPETYADNRDIYEGNTDKLLSQPGYHAKKKDVIQMESVSDHVHFCLTINFHTLKELSGFVEYAMFSQRKDFFRCILAIIDDTVDTFVNHPSPSCILNCSSQIAETIRFICTNFDSIRSEGTKGTIYIRGLNQSRNVFITVELPLMNVIIKDFIRTVNGTGYTLHPSLQDIKHDEEIYIRKLKRELNAVTA